MSSIMSCVLCVEFVYGIRQAIATDVNVQEVLSIGFFTFGNID